MTAAERCDEILRLIDDVLDAVGRLGLREAVSHPWS